MGDGGIELNWKYFITLLFYIKDADLIYSIYFSYYRKRTQLETNSNNVP